MKYLFIAFTLYSFQVFAQAPGPAQVRQGKAITALKAATAALSAQDLSCSFNSQCVSVGVGSKACGGPTGYVIASKRNYNYGSVVTLANNSRVNEQRYNQRWEIMSDCRVMLAPNPRCVSRLCK